MSIIKVLPENLVNQIAAGEVVERPASVVKELVENSIDAGADRIVVEVKDGGKTFMKITDNGCGMSREDAELALARHATSKIAEEADLWKIATMGFRGEALASISSVSKFTLKTRREEDTGGVRIECDGGDVVTVGDVGMSSGTVIEVHNLFFNTPARQKYLKKDSTELSQITSALNGIALANPGIAFKLMHNGKVVSDLPAVTDLLARVSDIFGKATADAMIPVFYGGSELKIDGFVGKPALSRSTSKHQYLFVNGRPVQNYLIANAVRGAFHSMLMEGKKPVFVMNLQIDPALIDVNVHPRKLEIRFEDQQGVIRAVYGCVKKALEKTDLTPAGFTEARRYMGDGLPREVRGDVRRDNENAGESRFSPGKSWTGERKSGETVQDAMTFTKGILAERDSQSLKEVSMKAVSQISNSYIVAKKDDGLILIDQHAAHERVRYEQLMDQFENQKKSVQPLLVPLQIEFSADEVALMEEHGAVFEGLGFEIEPFGGKTFVVHGVPGFLAGEDLDGVVKGVLDDVINEKSPSGMQGKTEEIINYMACRSAIKFGQKLDLAEMQALIEQMDKLKRPYTCPHGRPTMISLTLDELEKMFGRK